MKKIFFVLALFTTLLSCKKETPSPTPTPETPKKDTVPTPLDSSKIVLTDGIASIGEPIGKHGEILTDIEGNTYRTVIIGNQQWMAENLKVSKYNDGTEINATVNGNTKYYGSWHYYNNDSTNNTKFGKLYNWDVTNREFNVNRNVCPSGWHVPEMDEWDTLIQTLGGPKVAGGKMKEVGTKNWYFTNNDATNTSLFTALPAGLFMRDYFSNLGVEANWWTSTYDGGGFAIFVYINRFDDEIYIDPYLTYRYHSIRCIKDK